MDSRIPIEPGFFTLPAQPGDPPRLLGSRCNACSEHFFPQRVICAKCLSESLEDVTLGPTGKLYTYTYVHVPLFGSMRGEVEGYGVGQVDLDEGPRVQAVLFGGPEDFHFGMRMTLDLEPLGENEQGQSVVIFRFRPSETPQRSA